MTLSITGLYVTLAIFTHHNDTHLTTLSMFTMLMDINTLSVFKQSDIMQNVIMLCVMWPTDLSFIKLCFVS
jgi:hypothetical protein